MKEKWANLAALIGEGEDVSVSFRDGHFVAIYHVYDHRHDETRQAPLGRACPDLEMALDSAISIQKELRDAREALVEAKRRLDAAENWEDC